jgi:hypothetical protein
MMGAVLVILVLLAWFLMEQPGERSSESASQGPLVTFDSATIDKIRIVSPTQSITLERRGVDWNLTSPVSYKADKNTVGEALRQAKELTVKSVVSNRPEKQGVFQVDSTGTRVELFAAGTEAAAFIFGKMGGTYRETFARRASSDEVVVVEGTPGFTFGKTVRDWRDRSIVSMDAGSISEIRFQYGDTVFSVVRADSIWTIGAQEAKYDAVQSLISALVSLRADDFADDVAKTPKISTLINVGETQLRFAYDKEQKKYLVQSSVSPQWFVLESWTAGNVLKRKKDLI